MKDDVLRLRIEKHLKYRVLKKVEKQNTTLSKYLYNLILEDLKQESKKK